MSGKKSDFAAGDDVRLAGDLRKMQKGVEVDPELLARPKQTVLLLDASMSYMDRYEAEQRTLQEGSR